MTGWAALERFLPTDPRDVGCEQAMHVLHVYVELILDNANWIRRHRRPRDRGGTPLPGRGCSPARLWPVRRGLRRSPRRGSNRSPLTDVHSAR